MDDDAGIPGRAPTAGPRQTWAGLPWPVRTAVTWSACLLVVTAGLWLLGQIAVLLAPLAVALAGTLFLAALLDPVLVRLRRLRVPAGLAALLSILLLLGILGGAGVLVWNLTASQFGELSQQLDEGLQRTRDFVTSSLRSPTSSSTARGADPAGPEQRCARPGRRGTQGR